MLISENVGLPKIVSNKLGKQLGRPKTVNDAEILRLRDKGMSYTQIQMALGVSRPAIRRAIRSSTTGTPVVPRAASR
ncbi:MAG: helix-turn-helix domain-containing protein [Bdellovibrionales bacterium]